MDQEPVIYQQWVSAIKERNDASAYVEDILQELFVQFWEKRDTIDIR